MSEFKYMMTCGHNSDDQNACPFGCPDSKVLHVLIPEVEELEEKKEE